MKGFSKQQRELIAAKTNDYCCYCGIPLFGQGTIEHMLPKSKGGTNDLDNLAMACESCNKSKCGRTVEEFRKMRLTRAQAHLKSAISALEDVQDFHVDIKECVSLIWDMAVLSANVAELDVKFFFETTNFESQEASDEHR